MFFIRIYLFLISRTSIWLLSFWYFGRRTHHSDPDRRNRTDRTCHKGQSNYFNSNVCNASHSCDPGVRLHRLAASNRTPAA